MYYCQECNALREQNKCKICRNRNLPAPRPGDYCLLIEKEMIWSNLLADVLSQNEIPFYTRTSLGAAMAINLGLGLERHRFFVPYECLEKAKDIVVMLFSEADEDEVTT